MELHKAGYVSFEEEENISIYTHDFKNFYNKDESKSSTKDLKDWAVIVNSPWSQAHEKYTIKCNCKDGYTQMDKDDYIWKCEYSIVGYDGIEAGVYGYGFTEAEALSHCIEIFKYIQEKYNPEDEAI